MSKHIILYYTFGNILKSIDSGKKNYIRKMS